MSRRYVDQVLGGTVESRRAEAERERRRTAALEWGHRTGLEEWGQAWERARRRLARELGGDPAPAVVRRELTVLGERREGRREEWRRLRAAAAQTAATRPSDDGGPALTAACPCPSDAPPARWEAAISRARRCLSVWELTDERQIRRMLWELDRGCCEYRWDPHGGPRKRGGHIATTRGREPATGAPVRIGQVVDTRQGGWSAAPLPGESPDTL